jgi:hypothetical protein
MTLLKRPSGSERLSWVVVSCSRSSTRCRCTSSTEQLDNEDRGRVGAKG